MLTEAPAVTGAVTQVAKFAFRRPRPCTYRPLGEGLTAHTAEAERSFFSGHTSLAFAVVAAHEVPDGGSGGGSTAALRGAPVLVTVGGPW